MPKYGKASLPETYLKIADEILELLQQRDVSVSEEFVLMIVSEAPNLEVTGSEIRNDDFPGSSNCSCSRE